MSKLSIPAALHTLQRAALLDRSLWISLPFDPRTVSALVLRPPSRCGCWPAGEMKTDASRLPPNAAVDTHICKLVASGLGGAATLLAASLLAGASRTWAMLRAGKSADDIMREQEDLLDQASASRHRGLSLSCHASS